MGLLSMLKSALSAKPTQPARAEIANKSTSQPTRATSNNPTLKPTIGTASRQQPAPSTKTRTIPTRPTAQRRPAKLTPQPLLPAERIDKARAVIGKIEKHDLSDEQVSAIAGAGHNTLVLAGAGTGKTTTIVGYIAWLLATNRATPEEILVLSFTRKSADDMSHRIMASTGKTIRTCTFHSLGLEICRASTIAERPIIDGHASNGVVRATFERLLAQNIPYRLLAFKLMSKELFDKYGTAAKSEDFQLPTDDYGFNQYKQSLIENAQTIIQHMRQNNIDVDGMRELNERNGGKHVGRNREMLQLVEPLYNAYLDNFRATQGIDFPGMIVDAIRCVRRNDYRHPYKYVLIDEYQDMSRPRYELIRALREQSDFTLFCVGDDWQSIYRFAGSDIHLILDFAEIWRDWGPTHMFQITTTRRFRQSLIEASGKFVMQDKNLYVKHLHNPSDKKDYSLKALGGATQEERFDAIVEQLRKLPKTASVLMLGRYRSDLNLLSRNDRDGLLQIDEHSSKITFLEKPDMDIEFMTAHKSKGLQRDFVFLLCCSGGLKGFPSAIPDEPLLGLLLPEVERMPHAEERRLFYVAMTRCKKKLFFVVDQTRPSRFMYELHDRICPNIFRGVKLPPQCPNCGEALRLRHAGSDPSRAFYGCTGFPNCRFTQQCK
ncbi:UvrD-helicase domain-containing protein [Bifidobacterium ruminantium]|uniref:UvrD-helicase domain-containing protein n=1 Tax=Bifidobacterium ruminantium TaxID=78346 RepID=UPI001EF68E50|nr:UvrD-helicase domain-containing protein [Bifidobacterium ruminantium]